MINLPSDSDLDASADMLGFMSVAIGNDAAPVAPEVLAVVRALIGQNFAQLPLVLQLLFLNGKANNRCVQRAWKEASPELKLGLAQQFHQLLAMLGLAPGAVQSGQGSSEGQSLNADIASNIAWNASGAGDWSSR